MNDMLKELEKIETLGKRISKFSEIDKNTIVFYINRYISTCFNECEFKALMIKYTLKYKINLLDINLKLLHDKQVLLLLLSSILHSS
ncbi:hypothetical protein AFV9_gp18 [Betalipothrixvirus uzonense]|uniref:Uncharacterized protein n=1 Tax=Betalipothrixvirus uzonense TaxID=512792 RepID=B2CRJ5_9VIRU|nr:hypothetical protein AFV9_gp18 [Acidianus filamentous virus 9]ACB37252.1 hypothetical protein [Acidianus filamentous virus 9]